MLRVEGDVEEPHVDQRRRCDDAGRSAPTAPREQADSADDRAMSPIQPSAHVAAFCRSTYASG